MYSLFRNKNCSIANNFDGRSSHNPTRTIFTFHVFTQKIETFEVIQFQNKNSDKKNFPNWNHHIFLPPENFSNKRKKKKKTIKIPDGAILSSTSRRMDSDNPREQKKKYNQQIGKLPKLSKEREGRKLSKKLPPNFP